MAQAAAVRSLFYIHLHRFIFISHRRAYTPLSGDGGRPGIAHRAISIGIYCWYCIVCLRCDCNVFQLEFNFFFLLGLLLFCFRCLAAAAAAWAIIVLRFARANKCSRQQISERSSMVCHGLLGMADQSTYLYIYIYIYYIHCVLYTYNQQSGRHNFGM